MLKLIVIRVKRIIKDLSKLNKNKRRDNKIKGKI
jgi:hypothetical protein